MASPARAESPNVDREEADIGSPANRNDRWAIGKEIVDSDGTVLVDDRGNIRVPYSGRHARRLAEEAPKGIPCPFELCASTRTQFRYFNNKKIFQPRYKCRVCKNMWTQGGKMYKRKAKKPAKAKNKSAKRQSPTPSVAMAEQGPLENAELAVAQTEVPAPAAAGPSEAQLVAMAMDPQARFEKLAEVAEIELARAREAELQAPVDAGKKRAVAPQASAPPAENYLTSYPAHEGGK